MSNLVQHAIRELELVDEDPETIEQYTKVIQAVADIGHSGGSYPHFLSTLDKLLRFHNLSPITDDPNDWVYHDAEKWGAPGGVWQNKRNTSAFSKDGGRTFDLLSERNARGVGPRHISKPHKE